VPQVLTVGQFVYVIRKRIKIRPEKAVYVFIDSMCVCACPRSLELTSTWPAAQCTATNRSASALGPKATPHRVADGLDLRAAP
jgi:hypothetical protein